MRTGLRRGGYLALLLIFACAQSPAPPNPAAGEDEVSGPSVTFPDGFVVRVEIAADDESRAQGLMYRNELRAGTGMLFVFPHDGTFSFWMKNTIIALDMIWIDATGRVVDIEHDVPPCEVEDCPSYGPDAPARYVLEVAAGVARQHALAAGQRVSIDGIESVPAE